MDDFTQHSFDVRCAIFDSLLKNSMTKWDIHVSPNDKTVFVERSIFPTRQKMIRIVRRLRNRLNEDYCHEYMEHVRTHLVHSPWHLAYMTCTDPSMNWHDHKCI
jgi:hypothetical protein